MHKAVYHNGERMWICSSHMTVCELDTDKGAIRMARHQNGADERGKGEEKSVLVCARPRPIRKMMTTPQPAGLVAADGLLTQIPRLPDPFNAYLTPPQRPTH